MPLYDTYLVLPLALLKLQMGVIIKNPHVHLYFVNRVSNDGLKWQQTIFVGKILAIVLFYFNTNTKTNDNMV